MKRFKYRPHAALLTMGAICGIGMSVGGSGEAHAADTPDVGLSQQALDLDDLRAQCGFVCPGDDPNDEIKTLVQGNASISGIASVDGFFDSVLNFQVTAKSVAGGIDAELEAIRADFGLDANAEIGAALMAEFGAKLEGGFSLKVEPPMCKADIKAEFEAAARCDASVTPGMLSVDCEGGCDVQVEAAASCDASAELRCTVQAPEVVCEGECTGTCTVDVSAGGGCSGTCNGACDGECSAYVMNTSGEAQCAGKCSGMCTGSCDIEVAADASCEGKCRGECTLTKEPSAGCEGGLRAQCRAKAGASIKCDTKCDAEFEPPMVKAECQAKVQADAKMSVQCTPPRVAFNYVLKADAFADLEAQIRFENALKALVKVRLPALKASLERSRLVAEAGADLGAKAGGAVKGALEEARAEGGVDIKLAFGLGCALSEIDSVGTVISGASAKLDASISAATAVESALGM